MCVERASYLGVRRRAEVRHYTWTRRLILGEKGDIRWYEKIVLLHLVFV
jgi:hypothetical protein